MPPLDEHANLAAGDQGGADTPSALAHLGQRPNGARDGLPPPAHEGIPHPAHRRGACHAVGRPRGRGRGL
eukprot:6764950-Lingulodinium_polyedra.AAC.1